MNSMIILGMINCIALIGCGVAEFIDWYDELKEERKRKSPNRTKW